MSKKKEYILKSKDYQNWEQWSEEQEKQELEAIKEKIKKQGFINVE